MIKFLNLWFSPVWFHLGLYSLIHWRKPPGNNIIWQQNFDRIKGIFHVWFERPRSRQTFFLFPFLSVSFSLLIFFSEALQLKPRWAGAEFMVSLLLHGFNSPLIWTAWLIFSVLTSGEETKDWKSREKQLLKISLIAEELCWWLFNNDTLYFRTTAFLFSFIV